MASTRGLIPSTGRRNDHDDRPDDPDFVPSTVVEGTAPTSIHPKPTDVLAVSRAYGKLKVKAYGFKRGELMLADSPKGNYAYAKIDGGGPDLTLKCGALASNPIMFDAFSQLLRRNHDVEANLEEYLQCTWEPTQKFLDDETASVKVYVTHTVTCVVRATIIGDPEENSQSMTAEGRLKITQFGKEQEPFLPKVQVTVRMSK